MLGREESISFLISVIYSSAGRSADASERERRQEESVKDKKWDTKCEGMCTDLHHVTADQFSKLAEY